MPFSSAVIVEPPALTLIVELELCSAGGRRPRAAGAGGWGPESAVDEPPQAASDERHERERAARRTAAP